MEPKNDLGAGHEKQGGFTENEILKSPLSESQKKWVLTKPLFMIQGKRDDQLTDSELKEKRAWLEIHQSQKSQDNQPEEMQEDGLG